MVKHIEVVSYQPEWPLMFKEEASNIRNVLMHNCVDVHHIGSTSVPGLAAKPIIDIMVVVHDLKLCIKPLEGLGYVYKGEVNTPLRFYFNRKEGLRVNLHVVEPDHGFIKLNLGFRDYLKQHADVRLAYEKLKYTLISDRSSFERVDGGLAKYTLGKDDFIKGVLQRVAFDALIVNFCIHYAEWDAYHRIWESQLNFQEYLSKGLDNHFHLVLYRGTEIVAIAHVEFLGRDVVVLKGIATDKPHQRKGYGSWLVRFIEKWARTHNKQKINLFADVLSEEFFRKQGYRDTDLAVCNLEKTL